MHVDMQFSASARLITHVRRFVLHLYETVLPVGDAASRIALTTHELLENAVKYGTDGVTSLRIDLVDHDVGKELRITVRNHTEPAHYAGLLSALEEMRAFPDPEAYYHAVIMRSVQSPGASGLGLPRIHAEARMQLALSTDDEGRAMIVASTMLGDQPT